MAKPALLRYPLVAGLIVVLSGSVAFAQTRVPIRPAPKPGQVIHITTEQEILLRTGEKADEPGPAQIHNKNLLAYTQTNGTFNSKGQLDAQVTVERLELNETMGGRQKDALDTSIVKGRVLAVTFDQTGKLLAIKVPPDINNNVSLRLTQLLAGAYGMLNFVPSEELSVGQDTTAVSELPMRMPGSPTSTPLQARTTLTLRAIDRKGPDRIARLRQNIDVPNSTSQVKVTGGGSIDINLDRGFVSGTDVEWKISGSMSGASTQPPQPFFGSIRITVSAN